MTSMNPTRRRVAAAAALLACTMPLADGGQMPPAPSPALAQALLESAQQVVADTRADGPADGPADGLAGESAGEGADEPGNEPAPTKHPADSGPEPPGSALVEAAREGLGLAFGLVAAMEAPPYVFTGDKFPVAASVRLEGTGIAAVRVVPVAPSLPACAVGTLTIHGGVEVAQNTFVLASVPATEATLHANEEGRERALPASLDIDLTYEAVADGPADAGGTVGTCRAAVKVEPLLPLQEPFELAQDIVVKLLPPTPIPMGFVKTVGAADVSDGGRVVAPAAPEIVVAVVTPAPKVLLAGTIQHQDGWSYKDAGVFRYTKGGAVVASRTLHDSGEPLPFHWEDALPHAKGATVTTTYCLQAEYKDGGLYTDYEGQVETCTQVHAVEAEMAFVLQAMAEAGLAPVPTLGPGGGLVPTPGTPWDYVAMAQEQADGLAAWLGEPSA